MDKKTFRTEMRKREQEIPEEQIRNSDRILQQRFLELHEVKAAECIMLYSSMGKEIDMELLLARLVENGVTVVLPRCLPGGQMEAREYRADRLVRHKYGMLEPGTDCPVIAKENIDLILVPGLCFDRERRRMGRGGGFYDRYLSDYTGRTIALCRDVMLCDEVPCDPWDLPVDMVVTETEQYE